VTVPTLILILLLNGSDGQPKQIRKNKMKMLRKGL